MRLAGQLFSLREDLSLLNTEFLPQGRLAGLHAVAEFTVFRRARLFGLPRLQGRSCSWVIPSWRACCYGRVWLGRQC